MRQEANPALYPRASLSLSSSFFFSLIPSLWLLLMQKREHVKEIREKPADGELGEKLKEEEGKSNQKVKEQERM